MARVKCITMQRDEELLLEPWIRYYGYLFGFENLFIFDHGSVIPSVIDTLRFYEQLGVEVRWDKTTADDYHHKGTHFRNIIQHWDHVGGYDYAIPLDCDEFLAIFTADGVSCSRQAIHAHLDGMIDRDRIFGFDLSLFNVPGRPCWFWADRYPKNFGAADTIADVDFGNHALTSKKARGLTETSFVYIHYHYKSLERTRQHARQKLDKFVDPDDIEILRAYTGPGLHLVKHFLMDEVEYLAQFDDRLLIAIPAFGNLLRGLGITDPALVSEDPRAGDASIVLRHPKRRFSTAERRFRFEPARYAALHADVVTSGIDPLKHFLLFGHNERREI